jgi:hypothetical protein
VTATTETTDFALVICGIAGLSGVTLRSTMNSLKDGGNLGVNMRLELHKYS